MLYHDRILVSEENDVNKTSTWKKWSICHYWYFLSKGFKFQPSILNCCLDTLMMSTDINSIVISNINGVDYCWMIVAVSKTGATNLSKKCWFE